MLVIDWQVRKMSNVVHEFTIAGWLPSMNQWIAAQNANRYKGAAMKKRAQDTCIMYIKQHLRGVKVNKPVRIHYMWFERNMRRDHDNVSGFGHKVIQDALVQCGVIADDGWKNVVGYTDLFAVDRDEPRIHVMLEEIDE